MNQNSAQSVVTGFKRPVFSAGRVPSLGVSSWFHRLVVLWLALAGISTRGAELQMVPGHVPPVLKSLTYTGRLPGTNWLNLAIGLPLRNPAGLSNLLQQIYDPTSPNFHHYLTPEEFTSKFGPTEGDYQAVLSFARANHLQVTTTHPNRVLLDVSGSAAEVEQALHLTLHTCRHPSENRTVYAPDREPSLDLSVPVLHISGLDNYALPRPHLHATRIVPGQNASRNAGSGPSGTYMGLDFRAAYVPDSPLNGSGQVVGLLQFDGYTVSDITYYENKAGLQAVPLQNVLLDGFSGSPTHSGGEVEVSLDIEMAISMATNLSQVIVYEAGPYGSWHDILNRMANDNLARQLSCSWYIPGGVADAVADQIFQQMAAQGQSFFDASGDYDAYTGLISFAGDSPYITQVGGTTLTTSGPGGAWVSEKVWNWGDGIGSAGGISTQYPIPSWQTNISMASNQGSTTMRDMPDVAFIADQVYVRADGEDDNVGGTSCAAPLWAGFAALVNQQATNSGQPPIGFINPAVDAIGSGANYTNTFHDITTGNNTSGGSPNKFYAVAGYDLCTGWGTPAGQELINALANPEPLLITPNTGFSAIGGVDGPFFPVTSQNYSLTNGGTNALTWTLSNTSVWLNVSSSGGSLLPGGPATAVTVSLNNTASNLMVGVYNSTIWITNQNDQIGQSRQFTLSVISPPSITQQPVNQAVLEGAVAAFSAQATGGLPLIYQWQLKGTNLTDGAGITGSTTTNLTISSISTANVGNYTMVVTNFAGTATSSNSALTIVPSPPVISTQPASQSAVEGGNAQFTVRAIGTTPFSYQWSLDTTNITEATNATLTLTNVQLNMSGNYYSVQVSNVYGATNSATATLTVLPCDPPPNGLIGWWRAEGNANDSVGTNNGTPVGGASYAPGEVGQAFSFDGRTGYVSIPDSASLDVLTQSITVETWIKVNHTTSNSDWEGIVTKGNNSWRLQATSKAKTVYFAANGSTHDIYGTRDVNDGQWHHVAATYDGTSMSVYVDGTLDASVAASGSISQTSDPMCLGQTANAYANYAFDGLVDAASIYNRALTAAEIQAIYVAGGGGKCFASVAPTISAQPTNQTANAGNTAIFTVVAGGTPPLSYQWSFDTTNIVGATNATLLLSNVQPTNGGVYSVLVTNFYGSVVSSNAVLTVLTQPPTIITQPASQTNLVGTTASFGVTASGTPTLSYQWSFDTTNIVGATNATLLLANAQPTNGGIYSVLVTNFYGSVVSSNAVLTVLTQPPTIITQPVSQTNFVGATASFSVTASGTPPLSYQWSFDTTNIVGATNATLTLTNMQLSQSGNYAVQVTNLYGSVVSSNAVLTVNPPPPCDPAPSGLIGWWQAAGNANDSIGTNNGTLVGGATYAPGEVGEAFLCGGSTDYVLIPDSPSLDVLTQSITIECWVKVNHTTPNSNWEGIVTKGNNSWRLQATINAKTIYFCASGSQVDLYGSRDVNDGQWHHVAATYDGTNQSLYVDGTLDTTGPDSGLIAQTSDPLCLGNTANSYGNCVLDGLVDQPSIYNRALTAAEIQAIYAAGSSGKCPVPPSITTQPTNQAVNAGSTAVMVVEVTGTQPLIYQWSFNSTNLAGATNSMLTLVNVQPTNAGVYSVVVSNLCGSVVSSNAVLTVNPAPSCDPAPPGLIGWWQAAGNANDSIGTNNGTLVGAASYAPGEVGQAFLFDGTSGYVSIPDSPSLDILTQSITIETWIKMNHTSPNSTWEGIVTKGNNSWRLQATINAKTVYFAADGSTHDIYSSRDVNDGKWHHVAATYDGTNMLLYVDGTLDATQAASGAISQTSDPLCLGQTANAYGNCFFDGLVDAASIYNRALTAAEIQAIYAAGSGGKCPVPPGITTQPTNQTVNAGTTAVLAVAVTGTQPLIYQWSFDTTNIVGATNAALKLVNVQPTNTGVYSVVVTNLYGSVMSSDVVLTVLTQPPVILTQPVSQTNFTGTTASFSVTASGSPPLSYQWSFDVTNIVGATNATLTLTNVQLSQSGNYAVQVTDTYGSTNSATAVLTVNPPPPCDPPPAGLVGWWRGEGNALETIGGTSGTVYPGTTYAKGMVGQAFSFNGVTGCVMNTNTLPLTNIQNSFTIEFWAYPQKGITIPPQNNTGYPGISGQSYAVFPDWGGTGGAAGVGVSVGTNGIAVIEQAPSYMPSLLSYTNRINGWAHIAVVYASKQPVLYVNGVNVKTGITSTEAFVYPSKNIGNEYASGFTFQNYGPYEGLLDEVSIYSRALSAGEIEAINGTGSGGKCVPSAPFVVTQPANQVVGVGGTASLTVVAGGSVPLSYLWRFNGTNLSGATNFTLTLADVQLTNAGNYSVRVTNSLGSITSSNALLTVLTPPAFTQSPTSSTNVAGSTASFVAAASGGMPLSYQWQKNGLPLNNGGKVSGATTTSLNLTNVQDADVAGYALMVTNLAGSITSAPAMLVVLDPPAITLEPTNEWILVRSNAVLVAAASGTAPLGCQWSCNGTNLWDTPRLTGSQGSVLVISNAMVRDSGNYQVVFTNSLGSATSSVAVLAVGVPPQIMTEPASHSAPLGCTVPFSVGAAGSKPLADQWWKDGSLLTAQTTATLTVSNFQSADLGSYSVVVTNGFGSVTSSPAVLSVGYHPPVAGADVVQRFAAGGVRISAADLLANDVDTNGDTLTIIGVSSNSAAGGSVGLANNWVYYAPPAGWTDSDSFTYTVSDGLCGTDVGTVLVQVTANNPQPAHFAIAQANGPMQLSFTGIPGYQYQIQYADNMINPNWQVLTTQPADAFGVCQFADWSPTNTTARYYRAVPVLVLLQGGSR